MAAPLKVAIRQVFHRLHKPISLRTLKGGPYCWKHNISFIHTSRILGNKTPVGVKEHCNIGTIGHIDHGKTTLTAAITKVLSKQRKAKFMDYSDIDRGEEEKRRGITINSFRVSYETDKRHYAHTDCPGHLDYIKNMITGTSQMDAAILVVAATDGCMPQTREHLLLARQIGIKYILVFVNKVDVVDHEMVELVELEVRELLDEFQYKGDQVPVIHGSALKALNDQSPEEGEKSILKLLEAADNYVQVPDRDYDKPFYMPINSCLPLKGRGTVCIGTVLKGSTKVGTALDIIGRDKHYPTKVISIQAFHKSTDSCQSGDHVGVVLKNVRQEMINKGLILVQPNVYSQSNYFEATIYALKHEEGGRKVPIVNNYIQLLFSHSWSISCRVGLLEGRTMVMPGENAKVNILLTNSMVLEEGQRFTIRENQITSITGVITKVLDKNCEVIEGFNSQPVIRHVDERKEGLKRAQKEEREKALRRKKLK